MYWRQDVFGHIQLLHKQAMTQNRKLPDSFVSLTNSIHALSIRLFWQQIDEKSSWRVIKGSEVGLIERFATFLGYRAATSIDACLTLLILRFRKRHVELSVLIVWRNTFCKEHLCKSMQGAHYKVTKWRKSNKPRKVVVGYLKIITSKIKIWPEHNITSKEWLQNSFWEMLEVG